MMAQAKGVDAMKFASDQRPERTKPSSSSMPEGDDADRRAAISMLPPGDGSITCDSCDKDIKYVSVFFPGVLREVRSRRAWSIGRIWRYIRGLFPLASHGSITVAAVCDRTPSCTDDKWAARKIMPAPFSRGASPKLSLLCSFCRGGVLLLLAMHRRAKSMDFEPHLLYNPQISYQNTVVYSA